MGRAFTDLAFTPAVRSIQTRMGSRALCAPLDESDDRHDALTARGMGFIAARDRLCRALVSKTGWPCVQYLQGNDRVSLILMDYPNRRRLKLLGRARHCPKHITPRFTEAEVTQGMAPLLDELAALRKALNQQRVPSKPLTP